ncbi:MAG: patatin-like phospholipase family protein [Novosphingobium sp.]|nr:patatin-like phospholipase family protein [Novosphingobium sp.]
MNTQSQKDQRDIVLVLGDGAIRGGFVAGVVTELVDTRPDVLGRIAFVYGSSASSGNAIYLAYFGHNHPGERMWTELLTDTKFINDRSMYDSEPIYDIEYLVEDIFRKRTTLPDEPATDLGIIFPALVKGSSRVRYFANQNARKYIRSADDGDIDCLEEYDVYRLIGAASAAPFVYDIPFKIGEDELIDAATISPSLDALEIEGKDLKYIYAFCRKNPGIRTDLKYWFNVIFFTLFVLPFRKRRFPLINYIQYALKPRRMRRAFREALLREKSGSAVVIYPDQDLGDILDNSPGNLRRNFDHGAQLVRSRMPDIERLLAD